MNNLIRIQERYIERVLEARRKWEHRKDGGHSARTRRAARRELIRELGKLAFTRGADFSRAQRRRRHGAPQMAGGRLILVVVLGLVQLEQQLDVLEAVIHVRLEVLFERIHPFIHVPVERIDPAIGINQSSHRENDGQGNRQQLKVGHCPDYKHAEWTPSGV